MIAKIGRIDGNLASKLRAIHANLLKLAKNWGIGFERNGQIGLEGINKIFDQNRIEIGRGENGGK